MREIKSIGIEDFIVVMRRRGIKSYYGFFVCLVEIICYFGKRVLKNNWCRIILSWILKIFMYFISKIWKMKFVYFEKSDICKCFNLFLFLFFMFK